MKGIAGAIAVIALLTAAIQTASAAVAHDTMGSTIPAAETAPADAPVVPPVKGYAEGQEIWFIHTEASDTTVAQILTDMMDSPVRAVSSLADAPETMLARVYVFRNGLKGGGMLRFQPDVFDHPPGDPAYTPLRAMTVVTWKNTRSARVLTSAAEVQAAFARRELDIDELGVVVNMPLVTWPGGQR